MTWTVIPDVDVEAGGIPKGSTITAIRDNIIAAQGALKPIAEAVISSDATVDFTAFDNTRYRAYRFILENVKAVSTPVDLEMLFSTDGGSTFANGGLFSTSYGVRSIRADGDGVTSPGGREQNEIKLVTAARNTAGTYFGISGFIDMFSAGTTSQTTVHAHLLAQEISGVALNTLLQVTDAFFNGAVDTDAVRFQFSAGNLESGTIKMYGVIDLLETA